MSLKSSSGSVVLYKLSAVLANTAATTKIDGSSVSTGNITLTLKGNVTATNDTLVGGAGDDTLIVGYKGLTGSSLVELEAAYTFTGNGGTDIIALDTQADGSTAGAGAITVGIDFDTVTGVEKLEVRDADGATTAADLVTVNLAASVTTANVPAAFEVDGSVKTSTGSVGRRTVTSRGREAIRQPRYRSVGPKFSGIRATPIGGSQRPVAVWMSRVSHS